MEVERVSRVLEEKGYHPGDDLVKEFIKSLQEENMENDFPEEKGEREVSNKPKKSVKKETKNKKIKNIKRTTKKNKDESIKGLCNFKIEEEVTKYKNEIKTLKKQAKDINEKFEYAIWHIKTGGEEEEDEEETEME